MPGGRMPLRRLRYRSVLSIRETNSCRALANFRAASGCCLASGSSAVADSNSCTWSFIDSRTRPSQEAWSPIIKPQSAVLRPHGGNLLGVEVQFRLHSRIVAGADYGTAESDEGRFARGPHRNDPPANRRNQARPDLGNHLVQSVPDVIYDNGVRGGRANLPQVLGVTTMLT